VRSRGWQTRQYSGQAPPACIGLFAHPSTLLFPHERGDRRLTFLNNNPNPADSTFDPGRMNGTLRGRRWDLPRATPMSAPAGTACRSSTCPSRLKSSAGVRWRFRARHQPPGLRRLGQGAALEAAHPTGDVCHGQAVQRGPERGAEYRGPWSYPAARIGSSERRTTSGESPEFLLRNENAVGTCGCLRSRSGFSGVLQPPGPAGGRLS
jgi:hypothetical protein